MTLSRKFVIMSKPQEPTQEPTPDDFICVEVNEVENPDFCKDMGIEQNKKIFDIRKSGKRLWIKCDSVTVKYPFASNQYKTDAKEGTFVLNADSAITSMIELVDKVVKDEFIRLFNGKVLNNIMMTAGAINDMYRSSSYKDTMKVYVSPANCAVFGIDGSRIPDPDIKSVLNDDVHMGVVLEPAFAWMFQQKIGVHWDARQIKLKQKTVMPFGRSFTKSFTSKQGTFKNIFADSDDEDSSAKQNGKKTFAPVEIKYDKPFTLLMDSDDEQEEQGETKEVKKVQESKPKQQVVNKKVKGKPKVNVQEKKVFTLVTGDDSD